VFIHKTYDLDGKIFYWHVSATIYRSVVASAETNSHRCGLI
jgi:hypothetical protein